LITALDHVAISVIDLDASIRQFVQDLGLTLSSTEHVPTEATTTAFFPLSGTQIELIHPTTDDSALAKSIAKRGPGIHHICFRTDDIESDMARLKAKGYRFTSEAPRPGAHGTRQVFIHPKSAGGVLIELAEHPQ
jgi:methylmalonyl-CoA/ethylmalonyl-CoA epimerase